MSVPFCRHNIIWFYKRRGSKSPEEHKIAIIPFKQEKENYTSVEDSFIISGRLLKLYPRPQITYSLSSVVR